MIPTNSNNPNNCDPISSNCVIWQGPDLSCVNVCEGDSISDVLALLCDQLVILQGHQHDSGNFDITQINQTQLVGTPATTLQGLIQLIIDNIILNQGGTSSGHSSGETFGCAQVLTCTITPPSCFQQIEGVTSVQSNGTAALGNWFNDVSNVLCTLTTTTGTNSGTNQAILARVAALESAPKGEPNPRIYSSGVVTKNVLTPIATVTQAIDKQFIELRGGTGTAAQLSSAVANQPTQISIATASTGYTKTFKTNPTTAADAIYNLWTTIDDLRTSVKEIKKDCCNNARLVRMGSTSKLYTTHTVCATAVTNANGSVNCSDIWNSTGTEFDATVPAYTSPYDPGPSTELVNGQYYSLCGGAGVTNTVKQYSTSAPHWTGGGACG